ncbi:NYN domain-containing protein [Baffinella frigidus]|nr:NYN domain-containing protein [Cryptophyta sp. CCMP2293]
MPAMVPGPKELWTIMRSHVIALLVLAIISIAAAHDGLYVDVARGARSDRRKNYAVLVDAENSSWRKMGPILEEIAKFGDTTVRRVYGDFTMPSLAEWRQVSLELSFKPVSTMAHIPGKGSSDASLIIEAMDLLHTNPTLEGFALVSSDSDFTSLAQRLREAGKHLLGFGGRHTPRPFVISCERFIYTENLAGGIDTENVAGGTAAAIGGQTLPLAGRLSKRAIKLLTRAVEQLADEADGQGWVNLGSVKPLLTQFKPDFDVRTYGFQSMKALVLSEPRHFEGKVVHGGSYWIRLVGGSSEAGSVEVERGRVASSYLLAAASEVDGWDINKAMARIEGGGSAGQLTTDGIKLLKSAVQQATAEHGHDDGWVNLGSIKPFLMFLQPDFDVHSSGFENMSAMVLSEPRHFEVKFAAGYWIRLVRGSSDAGDGGGVYGV